MRSAHGTQLNAHAWTHVLSRIKNDIFKHSIFVSDLKLQCVHAWMPSWVLRCTHRENSINIKSCFFGVPFVESKECMFTYNSSKAESGTFTSPNFPGLYPRNTECQYFFYGLPERERVIIDFDTFDIYGYVTLRFSSSGVISLVSCLHHMHLRHFYFALFVIYTMKWTFFFGTLSLSRF